jgi:predicted DNA-binding transcriptional regulator AlpA
VRDPLPPLASAQSETRLSEPTGAVLARVSELLREAEAVFPDLAAQELPAALGEVERLRVMLSVMLSAVFSPVKAIEPDRLLDVSEAAVRLSVSPDTLYRKARDFPFTVRLGQLVRFSSAGIDRFIRTRQGH